MDENSNKKIKKQRGLGKGINALFDSPSSSFENSNVFSDDIFSENSENNNYDLSRVVKIKLRDIEPNSKQPRHSFDKEKLDALAESIKLHGMIQPILVQKLDNGMYKIIAGERRWRASKLAGLDEVPCIINNFDDKELFEIALIENLQREDLNPIEESEGYQSLIDKFGLTQEEVAERIGKSRSAVANSLRLNKLSKEIKALIIDGSLSQGHARALLSLTNEEEQSEASSVILKNGLNVRQTEKLVKSYIDKKEVKPSKNIQTAASKKYYISLEDSLSKKYNTKVKILPGNKKSKIEFEFYNNEDLERLIYELNK